MRHRKGLLTTNNKSQSSYDNMLYEFLISGISHLIFSGQSKPYKTETSSPTGSLSKEVKKKHRAELLPKLGEPRCSQTQGTDHTGQENVGQA